LAGCWRGAVVREASTSLRTPRRRTLSSYLAYSRCFLRFSGLLRGWVGRAGAGCRTAAGSLPAPAATPTPVASSIPTRKKVASSTTFLRRPPCMSRTS